MNPIKKIRPQESSDVPLSNEPLVSACVFLKRALQAAPGAAAKARQTLRSKVADWESSDLLQMGGPI